MAIIDCPGCGAKISDRAPACAACGLTRAEREQGRTDPPHQPKRPSQPGPSATPIQRRSLLGKLLRKRDSGSSNEPTGLNRLDCWACKAQRTMVADQVHRFHEWTIQAAGFVLAVPGALGIALSVILSIAALVQAGMALAGRPIDLAASQRLGLLALILWASGVVAGLAGWLLLSRRRVWRCTRCGFVLDRA